MLQTHDACICPAQLWKKKKTSVVRLFTSSIPNEKRTVFCQLDRVEKRWKVSQYSKSANDDDQFFFSRTEPILI